MNRGTPPFSLVLGLMMGFLIVVAGCARKGTSSTTSEVFDSTYVREVPRFITVTTPGDTVVLEKLIECDSLTNKPKPFRLERKSMQASATVEVDNTGLLTTTGVCDSLERVITAMDKEIFHLRREKTVTEKEEPIYLTRGIDRFCRSFTGVVMLLAVGYGFYKLNKFF